LGRGLGWVMGPKFSFCDGLGKVESGEWFDGLGWVGLDKLDLRTTLTTLTSTIFSLI